MELQKYFSKFLIKKRIKSLSDRDQNLYLEISRIIGQKVQNISYYREAFTLKNSNQKIEKRNYERLEFLGDAILGSIISAHLFETYPEANEGFLTQMKSKIVNRKNLNKLGDELGLKSLVHTEHQILGENISGNLLESLIGALYLDFGYSLCEDIVLQRLLPRQTINELENKIISYKGLLLEWSQKTKQTIRYETLEEIQANKSIVFRTHVWLANEKVANACEASKKKAEEKAAQRAFYTLNKKENILGETRNHLG